MRACLTNDRPAQGNTNDMARGIQGAIDAISGLTPMDPNGAYPPLVLIVADGKFAGELGRCPRALRVNSSWHFARACTATPLGKTQQREASARAATLKTMRATVTAVAVGKASCFGVGAWIRT
jgi:hypothetical protein